MTNAMMIFNVVFFSRTTDVAHPRFPACSFGADDFPVTYVPIDKYHRHHHHRDGFESL